jgi:predicted ester cyclase
VSASREPIAARSAESSPPGRRVRFGAIRIYRLTGGKVAETWAYQDTIGLLQQLRA